MTTLQDGRYLVYVDQWYFKQPREKLGVVDFPSIKVMYAWRGGEWVDMRAEQKVVDRCGVFIIGDKGVNEKVVSQLVDSLGWDGEISSFSNPPPESACQMRFYRSKAGDIRIGDIFPKDATPERATLSSEFERLYGNKLRQLGAKNRAAAPESDAGGDTGTTAPAPSATPETAAPAASDDPPTDTRPKSSGKVGDGFEDLPF